MENIKRYKKIYVIIQLVMILGAVIFLRAIEWAKIRSAKRTVLDIFICVLIIVTPLFLVSIQKIVDTLSLVVQKAVCFYENNKKKNIIFLFVLISGSIALYLLGCGVANWSGYRFKFWEGVFVFALSVLFYHDLFSKKIHLFFFCSVMIIGSLYVCEYPSIVGISWDDEIHYARTLKLANVFDGVNYEADNKIISEYAENIYSHNCFDLDSRTAYMNEVEELYSQKIVSDNTLGTFGIYSVAYIPSAIGVVIARGLGLNFRHMFMLGKFFNLLMYVILVTLAIRKTPYGKVLMTVVGMIPTMVFMAASYSYDSWVLGWTLLGGAYFLQVLSDNRNDNNRNLIISAVCITIGCLPKAIYFPLLLPLVFVGKEKIMDDKKRKIAKIVVAICMVVLVGSFLLPMLVHGAGTGDIRGGADVNSTEQIKFILQHPFQYFVIWFNFIKYYIGVINCQYLVAFAYAGFGQCYGIVMAVILLVGILDRMDTLENRLMIKGITVFSLIMILALVPTALYISFTAVASPTIAGCQYRYIIPIIFPALMFSLSDNITNRINHKLFALVPSGIMSFVLLYSLYINMVCQL